MLSPYARVQVTADSSLSTPYPGNTLPCSPLPVPCPDLSKAPPPPHPSHLHTIPPFLLSLPFSPDIDFSLLGFLKKGDLIAFLRLLQSGALPRKWELPPSLCPAHTTALTACSNSWLSAEISGSSCLHRTLTSIMSPDSTLSSPPVQQGLFHL